MEWTEGTLRRTLAEMRARRGDTTSIEVKRAAGGVPHMAETLCAFANMPDGGTVILGVDEAQGRFDVVGVKDVAHIESGLVSQARASVQPAPNLSFQTITIDGTPIVVAYVSPLPIRDRPAYFRGRAYLRQADGDYAMAPYELRMIEVTKLHADEQINYDLEPATGHSADDLVPDLVADYLASVRSHDRRLRDKDDEHILRVTNVLTASGVPTVAGLYALGDYPQGQFPALTVTAAVQLPGGEGQPRNRNLEDFTGPVPVLLEEVVAWVHHNLDTIHQYRPDGHMEAISELPINAVRELVANALVHRDLGPNTLGTGKQIQVRITPRNLFIQSPGGLRGISLAQIESIEHAQVAVNQRLYQMTRRLKTSDGASVIEGEGGGIREVFQSMHDRGLPRPQLIDTGVQFKAILWRPRDEYGRHIDDMPSPTSARFTAVAPSTPHSSTPTRNEPRIMTALTTSPDSLTLRELADAAGLTAAQVRYALDQPLREGIVVMDGRQGVQGTRYRINGTQRIA